VLKQESAMFGGKLTFLRRSDEAAEDLVENIQVTDAPQPDEPPTIP
jgi:hypothetical protein